MVGKIFDCCCGCGACAAACPVGAIRMTMDGNGFYKPAVSDDCISCGACLRVCPVEGPPSGEPPKGFFACAGEPERVRKSSSGGVFSLLAEQVIASGGVVYGCGWDENHTPRHMPVENGEELPRLYGSKYAQSNMEGVYPQVKINLNKGKPVLFSGTPCQVAGLRKYLKRDYENLIAVDFICHGVPSAKVLKKYLSELEMEKGAKVSSLTFRDKTNGWAELRLTVDFDDGSTYSQPASQDLYYRAFLCNLSLNQVCGECPFNALPRCADITLGDFWRIERHHDGFADDAGVSCVVINTEKGQNLFEKARQYLTVQQSTQADIMDGNPFLNGHCKLHKRRDKFFAGLDDRQLGSWAEECLKLTRMEWLGEVIRYRLGRYRES